MKQLKITDTHTAVSELFKHCLSTYRHSLRVGDELYRFACYLDMDDTDKIYMLLNPVIWIIYSTMYDTFKSFITDKRNEIREVQINLFKD